MASGSSDITQESVRGEVPEGLPEQVVRGVLAAYAEVGRICSENFGPEGGDLRGHLLRALVERNLRQNLAGLCGVAMRFEFNKALNSRHLVITCGRMVITASALETRGTVVRRAEFRESLARSAQGELFIDPDGEVTGSKLYLLVVHGPSGARGPAFIDLVPPTAGCDGYVEHARLSLLDEAARVTVSVPTEVVVPAAAELREDVAKEGEQA